MYSRNVFVNANSVDIICGKLIKISTHLFWIKYKKYLSTKSVRFVCLHLLNIYIYIYSYTILVIENYKSIKGMMWDGVCTTPND